MKKSASRKKPSILEMPYKPARVYTNDDANPGVLKGKTLAVLGFGSQGHAHALNLVESGFRVIIGLYPGSKSIPVAEEKGLKVFPVDVAVRTADVIMISLPDMVQPGVFNQLIKPNLTPGQTVVFLHGLTVHSHLLRVPKGVNVIMVAPKGPGHIVRRQYLEGKGVPSLIAVAKGGAVAKQIALAWAWGIGATRAGVIETDFKEEMETDLFGEQTVLCGGVSALMRMGFEVLVEAGYSPEMAYFECVHEMKLIIDLVNEAGISGMRFSISETAKWGDVSVGPKIIDGSVKKRMKKALKDIQSGKFVKRWAAEYAAGKPNYRRLLKADEGHLLEQTGTRLRSMMPWMQKRDIQGAQAKY